MLVIFRTKAHADITMFGDAAVALLKLAGLSGNVPTALLAKDIPAAIAKLEGGLANASAPSQETPNDSTEDRDAEPPVPLQRRAAPLIGLLRAAQAAGADVLIQKS